MTIMEKFLKNVSNALHILCHLFNFLNSYNTSSLPNECKLAKVVPIHKKGNKDDIKNYRPVSLTCLVTKLFENILKEELSLEHHMFNKYG